jgi:amino acid permease
VEGGIKELEVTDLALEFLGHNGKVMYQAALMLLTYTGLLAYTQVFNCSFVSQLWPAAPQAVAPAIFGLVVVPLSCFDLAEQVTVQVLMSLLRFLSLGVLLFGTLAAFYFDPPPTPVLAPPSSFPIDYFLPSSLPLANWAGFGMMITTAIFSQLFQHSVPGLIRPLSDEDKKKIPKIFKYALCTTAMIYISMGVACVAYFGDRLNESVNLNFVGFSWGVQNDEVGRVYVTILSMIVVLFPALDTLSVFPLIANTLGNNLHSSFPGLNNVIKGTLLSFGVGKTGENNKIDRKYIHKITMIGWRLAAAVPPIVASFFVVDLMFSLQVAGLCGIVVALVTPALLQRRTQDRVSLIPISMQSITPFQNCFNNQFYSVVVLTLAGIAMAISFAQMIV